MKANNQKAAKLNISLLVFIIAIQLVIMKSNANLAKLLIEVG